MTAVDPAAAAPGLRDTEALPPRRSRVWGKLRRSPVALVGGAMVLFFVVVAASAPPLVAIAALCVTTAGIASAQPIFWTFPTNHLTGVAAAAGIALINSIGNLGGFLAPNLRVWAEAAFGTPTASLYALAVSAVLGGALVLLLPRRRPG